MKSVTILTFLPSGLTTKSAREHHSVGLWHGVITCFACTSFMHASVGPLNCRGVFLKGVVFGFRCKYTCSDFIGVRVNSSLNTLGNRLSMSSLDEVSTERADGLGKVLCITPRQMRSCHEGSTGWARFDVARALLNTVPVFIRSAI